MGLPQILWVNAGDSVETDPSVSGWESTCRDPSAAFNTLKHNRFDAIVLQFPIPHWTPLALLGQIQKVAPDTRSSCATRKRASAMRCGWLDRVSEASWPVTLGTAK